MKEDTQTIPAILAEIAEQMCTTRCKWPEMEIPDGRSIDWLVDDNDSPCNTCPLRYLG